MATQVCTARDAFFRRFDLVLPFLPDPWILCGHDLRGMLGSSNTHTGQAKRCDFWWGAEVVLICGGGGQLHRLQEDILRVQTIRLSTQYARSLSWFAQNVIGVPRFPFWDFAAKTEIAQKSKRLIEVAYIHTLRVFKKSDFARTFGQSLWKVWESKFLLRYLLPESPFSSVSLTLGKFPGGAFDRT